MTGPWAAAVVLLWLLVVLLAVLVLGLLRRLGPVLERAERALRAGGVPEDLGGLPAGSRVQPFQVLERGRRVDFAEAGPADRVVLFVDASCPACTTLTEALGDGPALAGLPLVVVPGQSTPAEHYAGLAAAGAVVLSQPDGAASAAFGQLAFPWAVALAGDVVVGQTVPGSPEDLVRLASELRAASGREAGGGVHVGPRHH